MPVDMGSLLSDLEAETSLLIQVLAALDEAGWSSPTPAPGWSVKDQVTHLAFFDQEAVKATTDPKAFVEGLAGGSPANLTEEVALRHRGLSGMQALEWFRSSRGALVSTFAQVDPSQRVPWYGPEMSAASAVTARLMETWAHGQDILDALGKRRITSPGLRHVAHLAVQTLPNSFRTNGRPIPATPVRVVLHEPGGQIWTWGPEEAADRVEGSATDFCLVTTRRRHLADTSLRVVGPVATEWMELAQTFAGPPGPGRRPGQFPPEGPPVGPRGEQKGRRPEGHST